MILPALRGYYTVFDPSALPELGNHILVGCVRCKCQRVIYHKENCKNKQTRFPAYCLKCGSMIVVEMRKVEGGGRMAKKVKANYKRPQYVGKLKATGGPPPAKKAVKSWAIWDGPLSLFA